YCSSSRTLFPWSRPMLRNLFKGFWNRLTGSGASPPRSGSILLIVLRGCFLAVMIGIATAALFYFDKPNELGFAFGLVTFCGVLVLGLVVVGVDILVKNKQITTISAIYFGLLMGFMLGSLFWIAVEPIANAYFKNRDELIYLLRLFITLICCYISVSTLVQTKDEFRFIIPYVEFSKQIK